jgi:general secretion pathway protein J
MMPSRKGPAGLTLIEVMVAVTVLAMISLTIWTATSQTARTRDIVDESQDRLHQVRAAMNMITRDLESAFLSMHRATSEPTHDTIFIGSDRGDEDHLDFASFTHERRYLNANESDQCEVGYFLADDPQVSGRKNLVRRESPYLDLEPLEGGQYLVLVEDATIFDLQYFDLAMNEWQDTWDTTEAVGEGSVLPLQVRIRLGVHDRLGRQVVYGTQTPVPMRTPIWRKPFIPGPPVMVTK